MAFTPSQQQLADIAKINADPTGQLGANVGNSRSRESELARLSGAYSNPNNDPYNPYRSQGSVLGASTGGGSVDTGAEKKPNINGWYNELGNWEWMQQGNGGGQPDTNRLIDEAYGGLMSAYGQQEEAAKFGAGESKKNIEAKYGSDVEKTNAELNKLMRDIELNRQRFAQSGFAAESQNVGDYNALEQRANVRYGGGSSLGDLMRELAAKEYYKQQGGLRQQRLAGETDFANNINDTQLFFQQKISDLDLWKNEALSKVEDNLKSILANISTQRGQGEANKANAKLAALQQAQADAKNIQAADVQFRNTLFTTYLQQQQETMGRSFTPAEIANLYSTFNSPVFSPNQQAYANFSYNPAAFGKKDEEELNQL